MKRLIVVFVDREVREYWFAHSLLPFHLDKAGATSQGEEYVCGQHFDFTESIIEFYSVLNRLRLRWATENEIDNTLNFKPTYSAIVDIALWCGLVPFASVRSVHCIFSSHHSVQPFDQQRPWPAHRFYVSKFNRVQPKKRWNTKIDVYPLWKLFTDSYLNKNYDNRKFSNECAPILWRIWLVFRPRYASFQCKLSRSSISLLDPLYSKM